MSEEVQTPRLTVSINFAEVADEYKDTRLFEEVLNNVCKQESCRRAKIAYIGKELSCYQFFIQCWDATESNRLKNALDGAKIGGGTVSAWFSLVCILVTKS